MRWLTYCCIGVIFTAVCIGCGGGCFETVSRSLCVERQRTVRTAILIYAGDYDDSFPLQGKWHDEVMPYAGLSQIVFVCSQIEPMGPNNYGIAFNTNLAGRRTVDIADPAKYACNFDSTILTRNAESTSSTVPAPPRHGGNVIFRLDGAAVSTPPSN
jgi:hypothetical protein